MNTQFYRRLTGALFVIGAVLVNIPYTLLIMNFEYPDILREPTGYILTKFQEGGRGSYSRGSHLPGLACLCLSQSSCCRKHWGENTRLICGLGLSLASLGASHR